jgi:hypothetical protein
VAPRESPELAMIRARELERGNPNRATLAVARKMVCYMMAVERRQQDFLPAGEMHPDRSSVKPFLINCFETGSARRFRSDLETATRYSNRNVAVN